MEWWGWVTVTLTGIILIANAAKAIRDIFKPMKDMKTDIATVKANEEAHEKEAEEHFGEIDDILKKQEEVNQIIIDALFHLVNHEIDGNGIEGMKKVRDDLQRKVSKR